MALSTVSSDETMFADMLIHVQGTPLVQLVVDDAFIHGFQGSTVENNSKSYFDLVNLITDMFHDSFTLTSEQRREVKEALLTRSLTIRELYERHEVKNAAPTPPGNAQASQALMPPREFQEEPWASQALSLLMTRGSGSRQGAWIPCPP